MEALTARLVLATLQNPKTRKIWIGIALGIVGFFMVILFLFTAVFSSLSAFINPEGEDIYYLAVEELTEEYDIENIISVQTIRVVDLMYHGNPTESQEDVKAFIFQYFVVQEEDVWLYLEQDEIYALLLREPFRFTNENLDEIKTLLSLSFQQVGNYPLPVTGEYRITSEYGSRNDPLNPGKKRYHYGLDIQPAWHSPILAIADGTVIIASTVTSGFGNYVVIRHQENGTVFYTLSAHLSQVTVIEGQLVTQGEQIGLEGGDPNRDPNPGNTTGHHLHFEIRTPTNNRNDAVDPYPYLFEE